MSAYRFDLDILADKVMHYKRTKYKEHPNNEAMSFAFTEVADEYGIIGKHRGELKSEIGSILGKRKKNRSNKTVTTKPSESKEYEFTDVQFKRRLTFKSEGITFEFGFNANDQLTLVSWMGSSQPSEKHKHAAGEFAKNHLDKRHIPFPASVVLLEKDELHIALMIQDVFTAVFTRSDFGNVIARVSTTDGPCAQSKVPNKLFLQAKSIATQHFSSLDSYTLPGM